MKLDLTPTEAEALKNLLLETAREMDDDGREGNFDSTPLKSVYNKLRKALTTK